MDRSNRFRTGITLAALLIGWMGVSTSAAVEPSPGGAGVAGSAPAVGTASPVGGSPPGGNGVADLARRLREYIRDLKAAGPPAPGCKYG